MADPHWSEIAKNVASAGAIICGGIWALFKFVLARDHASNLLLTTTYDAHRAAAGVSVAFVTVRLENKGRRMLAAKARRRDAGGTFCLAYNGEDEKLRHACGLQVRPLAVEDGASGYLQWPRLHDVLKIGEINLLDEFEVADDGTIDFHLEPGEVVEVTAPLAIPPGDYVAKVHFVGAGDRMEYWSKLFPIRIDA